MVQSETVTFSNYGKKVAQGKPIHQAAYEDIIFPCTWTIKDSLGSQMRVVYTEFSEKLLPYKGQGT